MERNKSARTKNSAEKSSGEILPRDKEGNLMKSVAQTIIEADRFYTIAAVVGWCSSVELFAAGDAVDAAVSLFSPPKVTL